MITFEEIEGKPTPPILERIRKIYQAVFGIIKEEEFGFRMNSAEKILTILALSDGEIVGFKLGYQIDSEKFYSWVGGVKSEFRQQGIADEMMKRQHSWCRRNGFQVVQTKTKNSFKPMLILNIKHGFDIVELQLNEQDEPKIVLEKRLD